MIGRKRLPDPKEHERNWAFVAEVTDDAGDLREELRSWRYETKTRGERVEPEVRPVEGRDSIVDHDGHTHFAYVLRRPQQPGWAQEIFPRPAM